MGIKEKCKGLKAPESFWNTDEETLAMEIGGCGPGKFGDRIVPDTVYGLSIKPACAIHDWEYSRGLTFKDKCDADENFLVNMFRLICRGSKWLLVVRGWRIMSYCLGVYIGGGKSYKRAIAKFEASNIE